jgi:hypothetical protein
MFLFKITNKDNIKDPGNNCNKQIARYFFKLGQWCSFVEFPLLAIFKTSYKEFFVDVIRWSMYFIN